MSHFTRVRTQLRDLQTIKRVLEDFGYQVTENAQVRGYMGQHTKADIVAVTASGYDIGFRKEGESVVAVADFWGLHIDREQFLKQVAQRYAYITVMEQAETRGWQATAEEVQEDGSIRLVLQRWV